MNRTSFRIRALVGLLCAPVVAHAQDEAPAASRTAPAGTHGDVQRLSSAAAMGIHSLSVDSASPESMAFTVDIEQPLSSFVSVFAGGHVGVNLKAKGLQAGGRLYLSGRPYQGPFLALQGDGTLFDEVEEVSMRRLTVSGLIGYSQRVGAQWHIALAAGAGVSSLRQETLVRPSSTCALFSWCLLAERERIVETTETLHPVVRISAVHRF